MTSILQTPIRNYSERSEMQDYQDSLYQDKTDQEFRLQDYRTGVLIFQGNIKT